MTKAGSKEGEVDFDICVELPTQQEIVATSRLLKYLNACANDNRSAELLHEAPYDDVLLRKGESTYFAFVSSKGQMFVGWLFNVPATCECISGTDLLRQFYVLPH